MDSVAPLIADGALSADRLRRVVAVDGDLWLVDLRRATARRLTQTPGNESSPAFSADGRRVFFIRDGANVMAMDLDGPLVQQLTDVRTTPAPASPPPPADQRARLESQHRALFEAIRDRIARDSIVKAEREAAEAANTKPLHLQSNERIAQLSVSPSGRALLLTTFITATPRQAIVPAFVTTSGYTEDLTIRSKVGDNQTGGRLAFMELPTGKVTWLKPIPSDTTRTAGSIRSLGWNAAGNQALLFVEQSDYKARYINRIDDKGAITTIDILRDSAWVGGPCYGCGGFLPTGDRAWFVSEADGYAHLYTLNADGSDKRQLTRGKYEVTSARISDDGRYFELHTSEVCSSKYRPSSEIRALVTSYFPRVSCRLSLPSALSV